jgi:hypothetical protein
MEPRPVICGVWVTVFEKENIMRYGFIKNGSPHAVSITDRPFNPPTSEYTRVEIEGPIPHQRPYLYDPETKTLSTDEEAYEADQKAMSKRLIVKLSKQKAGYLQAQEDSGLDYSEEISEIQAKIDDLVAEINK